MIAAILGIGAVVLVVLALLIAVDELVHRIRIRRRQHGLTEREVAGTQAPYADISVWPSRAPINGNTHEDTE